MVDGIIIIITIKNKKRPEYDPFVNTIMRIAEKLIKEFGECLIRKELGLMSANNLLSGYVTRRTDYLGSKANGAL